MCSMSNSKQQQANQTKGAACSILAVVAEGRQLVGYFRLWKVYIPRKHHSKKKTSSKLCFDKPKTPFFVLSGFVSFGSPRFLDCNLQLDCSVVLRLLANEWRGRITLEGSLFFWSNFSTKFVSFLVIATES